MLIRAIKELKKLRKQGGMFLCEDCVGRICGKVGADASAQSKITNYKVDKVGDCYCCGKAGNYFVPLNKCVSAIGMVAKR